MIQNTNERELVKLTVMNVEDRINESNLSPGVDKSENTEGKTKQKTVCQQS